MLQITESNKFEIGPLKKARAFHYHWKGMGVRMRGETVIRHLFALWD